MHTHDDNPCWDAHCAPHLTHHDAATRELIARAEAWGAERALREAATAARGMHDPVAPECAEWADWLDARAEHHTGATR